MKYSKKNIYNFRKLNSLNKIKQPKFGYLISVPHQLLTKKYKKKCRNHVLFEPVYNFPRKKGKGFYFIITPRERKLLAKKKKTKKKICYRNNLKNNK